VRFTLVTAWQGKLARDSWGQDPLGLASRQGQPPASPRRRCWPAVNGLAAADRHQRCSCWRDQRAQRAQAFNRAWPFWVEKSYRPSCISFAGSREDPPCRWPNARAWAGCWEACGARARSALPVPDEGARRFYARSMGVRDRRDGAAADLARTEGWAGRLQGWRRAWALQDSGRPGRHLCRALRRQPRFLGDYLAGEVPIHLPRSLTGLFQTAYPKSACVGKCAMPYWEVWGAWELGSGAK